MPTNFEDLCDEVDAAVFTGDSLEFEENRELLHTYLSRWKRHLESYETRVDSDD